MILVQSRIFSVFSVKARAGAALAAVVGFPVVTPAVSAGPIEVDLGEPTLDRWMYPFNTNPGFKTFASVFGAVTDPEEGFHPSFDNRDGQMLVGFNTAPFVPTGQGPASYSITAAAVLITVKSDETFGYDPTADPYTSWLPSADKESAPDPDAGRPVELFGAGFQCGFTALTYPEDGPYCDGCNCFPPSSCKGERCVFPIDLPCSQHDASNNIDDRFDPVPFAVGMNDGLAQGEPVPAATELTFQINIGDPCVQGYLKQGLDAGILDFVVASIFPAAKQQEGTFPKFFTKEDPLVKIGVVSAARLQMSVLLGAVGDLDGDGVVGVADLLILFAQWGPCPDQPDLCPADLNGDGSVGVGDLLIQFANWG